MKQQMFLGQLLDFIPDTQWLNIVKNNVVLYKGPKTWLKETKLKDGKLGSTLCASLVKSFRVSLDKKKETKIMLVELEGDN